MPFKKFTLALSYKLLDMAHFVYFIKSVNNVQRYPMY